MSSKQTIIPGIGPVDLVRLRNSKSLRLSVDHEGRVRVSMPTWTPYRVGVAFARSKAKWLLEQKSKSPPQIIKHGHRIGKAHRLEIRRSTQLKPSTRVSDTLIVVNLPTHLDTGHPETQKLIHAASVRALKQESNRLILLRLSQLARQHGFTYRSARIKQLKSRWGSCGPQKDIIINCYLIQLHWDLIDYVLLHELMHTKIMAHGPKFWAELDKYIIDLKDKRRRIRVQRPSLMPQPISS